MWRLAAALIFLASAASCRFLRSEPAVADPASAPIAGGPRILAVLAHPDDETTFAGTLYKCATHLDAICDVVVITNGEGGYTYSTLAERIYGLELTREEVGRAHLPRIRAREMKAACELLGVRDLRFLRQPDHRYTTDESEVLAPGAAVWDLDLVRAALQGRIQPGAYDFVLTLLPTPGTHAHHKAATLLALEAIASLPRPQRPVPLGAGVYDHEDPPEAFRTLAGHPLSTLEAGGEAFVFDRTQGFGHEQRLDYRIVVDWVIAEHKSQGTMQLASGRGDEERFYLYAIAPADAADRARALFEELRGEQFTRADAAGRTPASSTEDVSRQR